MSFQIAAIYIWPQANLPVRQIILRSGSCNIIGGPVQSGKSSLFKIIDYCLGSTHNSVPPDIRRVCHSFAIVITIGKTSYCLARSAQQTSKTFPQCSFSEVTASFELKRPELNLRLDQYMQALVASMGHRYAMPLVRAGGLGQVVFRDITPLIFQPQDIVASSSLLFYKCEIPQKFTKLRAVLPFLIKDAVSAEELATCKRNNELMGIHRAEKLEASEYENNRSFFVRLIAEAEDLGILGGIVHRKGYWQIGVYLQLLEPIERNANRVLSYIEHSDHLPSQINVSEILGIKEPQLSLWSDANPDDILVSGEKERFLDTHRSNIIRLARLAGSIKAYQRTRDLYQSILYPTKKGPVRLEASEVFTDGDKLRLPETMRLYSEVMDLDLSYGYPHLELTGLKLQFIGAQEGHPPDLSDIGGVQNWLGFHIALFLSLHELFISTGSSPVPPFLVIDHISQAFFSDANPSNGNEATSSYHKLGKIYTAFDMFLERTKGKCQLIVLDRILPKAMPQSQRFYIAEKWELAEGLLPGVWK